MIVEGNKISVLLPAEIIDGRGEINARSDGHLLACNDDSSCNDDGDDG